VPENNKSIIIFTASLGLFFLGLLGASRFGLLGSWEFDSPYFNRFLVGSDFSIDSTKSVEKTTVTLVKDSQVAVVVEQGGVYGGKPFHIEHWIKVKLSNQDKNRYDSMLQSLKFLAFTEEGQNSMQTFFEKLSESQKELSRIWYFGDSQIEGDRITSEIRRIFQSQYGGSGMGYVPLSNPATYGVLEIDESQNSQWKKLNCFRDKKKFKWFGPSGQAFVATSSRPSEFRGFGLKITKSVKYQKLLIQALPDSLSELQWRRPKDSVWKMAKKSIRSKFLQEFVVTDTPIIGKINFRYRAINPVVYGYSIDAGTKGVQIDNMGIRGHSGDGLNNINSSLLSEESQRQNVSLVVLHFGNNMVPYIKTDGSQEKWVKNIFRNILNKYQSCCPDVSILLIGPGDMGYRSGGEMKSYESCKLLNRWLQEVAQEKNVSFFDFYGFMLEGGGILEWQKKGLASLDGHLSPSGQKIFARALTRELNGARACYLLSTRIE
jgi:lysophospholipase L1-like esterase